MLLHLRQIALLMLLFFTAASALPMTTVMLFSMSDAVPEASIEDAQTVSHCDDMQMTKTPQEGDKRLELPCCEHCDACLISSLTANPPSINLAAVSFMLNPSALMSDHSTILLRATPTPIYA